MATTLREALEELRRRRDVGVEEGQLAPVGSIYASVLKLLKDVPLQAGPSRKGPKMPLIGAKETARRLGVDRSYLYRHAAELPFAVELPGGNYRFDPVALERYIAQQTRRIDAA